MSANDEAMSASPGVSPDPAGGAPNSAGGAPDPAGGTRGLEVLLAGVSVVWVCPTSVEAEVLIAALRDARSHRVATKQWWLGRLSGRSGATAAPVLLVVSGYDKANAAHALTCVLQAIRPRLVVLCGIAGAFPSSGLRPGDLALADSEIYADTGSSAAEGWLSAEDIGLPLAEIDDSPLWNVFPVARGLLEQAEEAVGAVDWRALGPESIPPETATGPFVTSSRATGTAAEMQTLADRWDPVAETMEGAAAAHICALYGVPFLEIRGISNLVGPRNRDTWRIDLAVERVSRAVLAVTEEVLGGDPEA